MVDRSLLCRWSHPLNPPLLRLLVSTSPGLFNNDKIWACSAWIFPGTTQRGGSRVGGGGYTVCVANRTLLNVGGSLHFFSPCICKTVPQPSMLDCGTAVVEKNSVIEPNILLPRFQSFFFVFFRSNSDSSGLLYMLTYIYLAFPTILPHLDRGSCLWQLLCCSEVLDHWLGYGFSSLKGLSCHFGQKMGV